MSAAGMWHNETITMTTRHFAAIGLLLAVSPLAVYTSGLEARNSQQPPPAAGTQAPQQQAPPTFKTGVDLVAVDVSVVDSGGRPVRGLEAGDFSLTVDGRPRRLASVQYISQETAPGTPLPAQPEMTPFSSNQGRGGGRMVLIVVDQGNIGAGSGRLVMETVGRFLARLGPGDRAALAVIPGGMVVNFTRHHALVRDAVGKVFGTNVPIGRGRRVGITEALAIGRKEPGVLQQVVDRECGGPDDENAAQCSREIVDEADLLVRTAYNASATSLNALRSLIGRLAPIEGPKTVILISEGLIIDRETQLISWVSEDTARARASVYGIRLIPPTFDVNDQRQNYSVELDHDLAARGMDMLVGRARGTYFAVANRGEWAFDRLALEMTGYYLLGFEPEADDRNGKSHAIAVKVNRPSITVRARRQFVAPPAAAGLPSDDDIIKSVLAQPLLADEIALKVTTRSFKDPASEKLKLVVAVDIGRPAEVSPVRALGFLVADDRGEVQAFSLDTSPSAATPYVGAALVSPGVYTLKLAAIDEQGRRGSVEHRFDARLRVGGPFRFGDLMLADGEVGSALRPKIEPRVSRQVVTGYSEIYASDPARFEAATVAFEVAKDANAPPLASREAVVGETAEPGRRLIQGSVPVTQLEPGNYVLRAIVSVAGKPVARFSTPFTLIAASAAR
jgi:VWFA-related protein